MASPQHPRAVLWDYDGTLLDTEPIWIQSEKDLAAEFGLLWTDEQAYATTGISGREAAKILVAAIGDPRLDLAEVEERRARMVAESVRAQPPTWRPGARELLEELVSCSIPCALFSSSPRFVVDAGLSWTDPKLFRITITGDEVIGQKPQPDGYLLAASRLGVDPSSCLVIEDSPAGVAAGVASGAAVLGIPNVLPLTPGPSLVVRESLEPIRVADLSGIYQEARSAQ